MATCARSCNKWPTGSLDWCSFLSPSACFWSSSSRPGAGGSLQQAAQRPVQTPVGAQQLPPAQRQPPQIAVNTSGPGCPEFRSRGSGSEQGPAGFVCVSIAAPRLCWCPATRRPAIRWRGGGGGGCFPHCWNSTPVCLLVPMWLQTPSSFLKIFSPSHFAFCTHTTRLSNSNTIPGAPTVVFVIYSSNENLEATMVLVQ